MAEPIAPPRKLKYIPAFDGIRGLFCLIIISHHLPVHYSRVPFAFGWEILQLFFVMSGYLITSILLKDKNYPFKEFASRFYMKRFYRIFPLYFFFIFLCIFVGYFTSSSKFWQDLRMWEDLQINWGYLVTYTFNLKEWFNFKADQMYSISPLFAHLWSLSLEEQFYIFYPLIVFFLSEKSLKITLVSIVILSPFIRLAGFLYMDANIPETYPQIVGFEKNDLIAWILHRNTIFQLDALSLGGCLALFNFDWIKKPVRLFWIIFVVFLVVVLGNAWLDVQNGASSSFRNALMEHTLLGRNYQCFYLYTLVNFLMAALILVTFKQDNPFKIFENKTLIKLGQISYGLYVYHFLVLAIYMYAWQVIGRKIHIKLLPLAANNIFVEIIFVLCFYFILIKLSQWSFKYFESYFLNLKANLDKAKK
ncbi:MAG: acyltransferase [Bacteroidetes bacterium]|jgi:peptidoglycan/LPS O-acetylase OafA/YrhL|nr:acyltransferase [Bacteroidota bacterium]MBK9354822.1 acyltransferase [Bacteroidota bacterium]